MQRGERGLLAAALVLAGLLIALVCDRPTGTIDLWWTLKVGDHIRATGEVPHTALWTIDALRDRPYVCHEWLAALVFSGVAAGFGVDALPCVPTLVALAIFALLIGLGRQLGASGLLAVAIAALGLWVVVPRMICRAEVFGYLFFALTLNALAAFARTRRPGFVLALVPLALVWVNTHGSVLILLALLPVFAAGLALDAWRRASFRRDALWPSLCSRESAWLSATWLGVAAALPVNPYGLELLRHILDPMGSSVFSQAIEEWVPLYSLERIQVRFVVPLALVAASLAVGFRRLSGVSVLLALFLAGVALSANRHLPLFGLGVAYLLADFARGVALAPRGRLRLAAALVVVLLATTGFTYSALGLRDRSLAHHPSPWLSERGFGFILHNVRGNVLNRWQYGGVLIYFAYPQIRVAIDSRADPYPTEYFRSYQRAIYGSAHDTLAFVDRYDMNYIILDRALFDARFRRKLPRLDGFRIAFLDERTVVLSRGVEGVAAGPPR